MQDPFNQAAKKLKNDVTFIKVDADNEKFKDIADSFGVEAIPTIIFKQVGIRTKDQLTKGIQTFLGITNKELAKKGAPTPKKAESKKPIKKAPTPGKKTPPAPKKSQPPVKKATR